MKTWKKIVLGTVITSSLLTLGYNYYDWQRDNKRVRLVSSKFQIKKNTTYKGIAGQLLTYVNAPDANIIDVIRALEEMNGYKRGNLPFGDIVKTRGIGDYIENNSFKIGKYDNYPSIAYKLKNKLKNNGKKYELITIEELIESLKKENSYRNNFPIGRRIWYSHLEDNLKEILIRKEEFLKEIHNYYFNPQILESEISSSSFLKSEFSSYSKEKPIIHLSPESKENVSETTLEVYGCILNNKREKLVKLLKNPDLTETTSNAGKIFLSKKPFETARTLLKTTQSREARYHLEELLKKDPSTYFDEINGNKTAKVIQKGLSTALNLSVPVVVTGTLNTPMVATHAAWEGYNYFFKDRPMTFEESQELYLFQIINQRGGKRDGHSIVEKQIEELRKENKKEIKKAISAGDIAYVKRRIEFDKDNLESISNKYKLKNSYPLIRSRIDQKEVKAKIVSETTKRVDLPVIARKEEDVEEIVEKYEGLLNSNTKTDRKPKSERDYEMAKKEFKTQKYLSQLKNFFSPKKLLKSFSYAAAAGNPNLESILASGFGIAAGESILSPKTKEMTAVEKSYIDKSLQYLRANDVPIEEYRQILGTVGEIFLKTGNLSATTEIISKINNPIQTKKLEEGIYDQLLRNAENDSLLESSKVYLKLIELDQRKKTQIRARVGLAENLIEMNYKKKAKELFNQIKSLDIPLYWVETRYRINNIETAIENFD